MSEPSDKVTGNAPERIHVHIVFDDKPMRLLSVVPVPAPSAPGPQNFEADYVRADVYAQLRARVAKLEQIEFWARAVAIHAQARRGNVRGERVRAHRRHARLPRWEGRVTAMTPDHLAAIEARAAAATPGPWTAVPGAYIVAREDDDVIIDADTNDTADFVAACREDIPALIAALRAAEEALRAADAMAAFVDDDVVALKEYRAARERMGGGG